MLSNFCKTSSRTARFNKSGSTRSSSATSRRSILPIYRYLCNIRPYITIQYSQDTIGFLSYLMYKYWYVLRTVFLGIHMIEIKIMSTHLLMHILIYLCNIVAQKSFFNTYRLSENSSSADLHNILYSRRYDLSYTQNTTWRVQKFLSTKGFMA